MTNDIDMSKVVLWQYDNAKKFLRLLRMKEDLANYVVKDVWDWYQNHLFGIWTHTEIDEYDSFGLWLWGTVMGVPRPLRTDGNPISDIAYLHLLKARFFMMNAAGSAATLNRYLSLVFDAGEGSSNPGHVVTLIDNYDMTMRYAFNWAPSDDEAALISSDWVIPHPTGVKVVSYEATVDHVFGFDGYYESTGNKMVELTDRTYYGYVSSGTVVIRTDDLYAHKDGTRMPVYHEIDGDYYYFIEIVAGVATRVRVGQGTSYAIYWQTDTTQALSSDVELTNKVDVGSFVYDSSGDMVVASTITDKYGHTLTRDNTAGSKGWYYMNGAVKVYVLGQNLGTFNSSVFKPESGETE